MTKTTVILCAALLLLQTTLAKGQEWDLGGYDYRGDAQDEDRVAAEVVQQEPTGQPGTKTDVELARMPTSTPRARAATLVSEVERPDALAVEAESVSEHPEHIIRFGAGASWLHPLRLTDRQADDRLLSDFSASWTPFGLPADIGVDLLIARDQQFFVRPNLKLFLYRHYWFSLFVEGTCELMFLPDTTEVGGGGGLGMVIGLSDTLAIEIKAGATVIDLSPGAEAYLFGPADDTGADFLQAAFGDGHLAVLPSASIHLMARF